MTRRRNSKPARQRVHFLGHNRRKRCVDQTNAGALLADDFPIHQSRIFCTRWNGLTMTSGLGEALDDAELEGSVIGQLKDAVAFIRNNSHKRWWKESDHREELPDYPERAVTEVICNAIIHRDYQELGSEIHIDIYDDRMEVYSPGGMIDGLLIQQLNPLSVPSKRRNPSPLISSAVLTLWNDVAAE